MVFLIQITMRIFIYGVPGSGKTYFSKIVGRDLGLQIIEADSFKKKVQTRKPKDKYPFLYSGTCGAYKQFGQLSQETAVKGLTSVRQAFDKFIQNEIKRKDQFVLEGAFLNPLSFKDKGILILIVTTDEKKHQKQYFQHREKLLDITHSEFRAARIIQEFLIKEAKGLGIKIIENDASGVTLDITNIMNS